MGIESTIAMVTGEKLTMLRPGPITARQLEQATGLAVEANTSGEINAPGMLKSHYAPDTKLAVNITNCPSGAALLSFGPVNGKDRSKASVEINLSSEGDLQEAAANLYRGLAELDASGATLIAAEPIPQEGLGIAINDRLNRAAAPKETA